MDVKWTSEQKKVIDLRDRDILVSAAAGSGKTAVLVERIVNRICVDNPPVDIDRMLVVTFTKAAAAEMRQRVSRAIDSLKEQKPDDENLQRQSTLVHNALITTIDSFCLFVVQNNFAQLNLDPDFRIGDQAELKLMLKDALAQVFEDNYAREDNEAFINLIDTYSKGRNDSAVRQMVEDIYYKAGSSSWPRKWMNSLLRLYDIKSAKQLEDSEIIKEIVDYSRVLLEEAVQELTMAKDLASATPGLEKYALTLSEDIALFDGMAFAAALIRNLLGLGSLLAFPGSMIGALLCGVAYRLCPKLPAAYAGEVFGTGILGGLASYPIAAVLMGNTKAALFTFVPSFLISTAVGAAISVLVLSALKRTHVFSSLEGALR